MGSIASLAFYTVPLLNPNAAGESPDATPLWTANVEQGEYTPDTPPWSALSSLEGASIALFIPAIFIDDDENGLHSANESFLSVADSWMLYATGIDCELWPELTEGWSYASVDRSTGSISSIEDGGEIAFTTYIDDSSVPSFEVTRIDDSSERIAVIPEIWRELNTTTPLLLDQEIDGDTFTVTLPEWPIDEHLQAQDINGERYSDWFYSVELFATYWDSDLSMSLTSGDVIAGGLCLDGSPLAAVNTPNADTIDEALYMSNAGIAGGWALWREVDGEWEPTVLTHESVVESGERCLPPSALL